MVVPALRGELNWTTKELGSWYFSLDFKLCFFCSILFDIQCPVSGNYINELDIQVV